MRWIIFPFRVFLNDIKNYISENPGALDFRFSISVLIEKIKRHTFVKVKVMFCYDPQIELKIEDAFSLSLRTNYLVLFPIFQNPY